MPLDPDNVKPEEWEAARRLSDTVGQLIADRGRDACVGRWVAWRLDGSRVDQTLYDTRNDAMRHQLWENLSGYIRIPPDGVTPKQAWVHIVYMRQFYENGGRFSDEMPRTPMLSEELGYLSPRLGRMLRPGLN